MLGQTGKPVMAKTFIVSRGYRSRWLEHHRRIYRMAWRGGFVAWRSFVIRGQKARFIKYKIKTRAGEGAGFRSGWCERFKGGALRWSGGAGIGG